MINVCTGRNGCFLWGHLLSIIMDLRPKHQLDIQMMHGVPNKHAAGKGILDSPKTSHHTVGGYMQFLAICFPIIGILFQAGVVMEEIRNG